MRVRIAKIAAALTLLAISAIYFVSEARLDPPRDRSWAPLASVEDGASIERGRHVGERIAQCTFCHGADWAGNKISDDLLVGRLYSSNLTSGEGGIGAEYDDEDWIRAIRHGRGRGGENLWFMPAEHLVALSDRDLASLILYIRTLEPVDRVHPERRAGPATRVAVALGLAPELAERPPLAPKGGPHPHEAEEEGAYLARVGICGTCHRPDLRGGRHPLAPPHEPVPPDISANGALARWSEAEFIRTMRSGRSPAGRLLDPVYMPWPRYAGMTDRELGALYRHLTRPNDAGLASVASPPPPHGTTSRESAD